MRDMLGTQAAFRGSQPDFVCSPPRAEANGKAEADISYLPVEPSPPGGASRTSSDDAINSVASTMSAFSFEVGGCSGNPLNSRSGCQHRLVLDVSAGACGTEGEAGSIVSAKGEATSHSSGPPLTGVTDVRVLRTRAAPRGSQPAVPRAEASADGISGDAITSAASSTDDSSIALAAEQQAWPPSHQHVIDAAIELRRRAGTYHNSALDDGVLALNPKMPIDFIASFGSAPPPAGRNLSAMCVHRDNDPVAYVQFFILDPPAPSRKLPLCC